MKFLKTQIITLLALPLCVLLFGLGNILVPQTAYATTCSDGTAVPARDVAAGTEDSFCNSHNGVSSAGGGSSSSGTNSSGKCADGTTIPNSAIVGGHEADFCSSHGSSFNASSSTSSDGATNTDTPINACSDTQQRDTAPTQCATQKYQCGTGDSAVKTTFNFGCVGAALEAKGGTINPLLDLFFAITRFITDGVGVILVIMMIVAGIRYTTSTGDPQKTEAAIKMIRGTIVGLLVYLFVFAAIQWLVPGGVFNAV